MAESEGYWPRREDIQSSHRSPGERHVDLKRRHEEALQAGDIESAADLRHLANQRLYQVHRFEQEEARRLEEQEGGHE